MVERFEELKGGNKANNLQKSLLRNGIRSIDGGPSVGVGVEGVSGLVDGSTQVDTISGGDLSKEGKHTNTSVLDLDVSETVESLLVDITVEESQRIEESKRRLGTKLRLESVKSSGGLSNLGWSEGGSRADKRSEEGKLHGSIQLVIGNCSMLLVT